MRVGQNGSPVFFIFAAHTVEKTANLFKMSQQPFQKFINPKNNAAVKEKHKQDKKISKKHPSTLSRSKSPSVAAEGSDGRRFEITRHY